MLCSISWAAGSTIVPDPPAKGWPKLTGHLRREDFTSAADEVKLDETKTKGVAARNVSNRLSMLAAAAVVERGADPDVIYERPEVVPGVAAPGVEEPSREAREAYAQGVLATRMSVAKQNQANWRRGR